MKSNQFAEGFRAPDVRYWPEFRWWLAEGFHTDKTLKQDVAQIYDSGFGAIEILSLDDPGADSKRYGWGSEEWTHDQNLLLEETTRRGMGFSMTSGANWSNANLISIRPDDPAAAKELDYVSVIVAPGQTWSGPLPKAEIKMPEVREQLLVAVVAGRRLGKKNNSVLLDLESLVDLTGRVSDGALTWTAPDNGEYELFFFWMHGTGQTAEPTAKTSYTINYIDRYGVEAWIDYWDKQMLSDQEKALIRQNGRVQIYMDSLELSTYGKGGQFWGYHVLEEFRARRGYDLTRYLPLIVGQTAAWQPRAVYNYAVADDVFTEKLHNDLYQTLTDLYICNALVPLNNWLHTQGMGIRAEISYCMPFEISQPGFAVDGIEAESLEFASQIDCFRGMAGAAHIYGKLFSSETGCAMQNYKKSLNFYDQIIYTQFAAGIARTVLHGYSSIAGSEGGTQWPGHEGMLKVFSERFGCRQPSYDFYPEWSKMLARFQYVLRQGKPRMDLGILRLDYRYDPTKFILDEDESYDKMWMRINEGIYWKDTTLQNHGYTYDYFAPHLLSDVEFANGEIAPEGPGYQALIIYQDAMPLESAARILDWARKGLPVVFVNGVTECIHLGVDVTHGKAACKTPFLDGKDAELAEVIGQIKACDTVREVDDPAQVLPALLELNVQPRLLMEQPSAKLLPFLRQDGDTAYLYLYNCMHQDTEPERRSVALTGYGKPYRLDCWTGNIQELAQYRQEDGRTILDVTVAPGEAQLFALDCGAAPEVHVTGSDADCLRKENGQTVLMACSSGRYTTTFSDGAVDTREIAVPQAQELTGWTLQVEDWNEGEKHVIEENRGLGYVTREVWYDTRKDCITVENADLKPWKDLPEIGPDVSGVGHYTTRFTVPESWDGAFLQIGDTGGNPVFVTVNGKRTEPVNSKTRLVDISLLLQAGENTLQIDVPSTLGNRMRSRKYYRGILVEMTSGERRERFASQGIPLPTYEEVMAMTEEEFEKAMAAFPDAHNTFFLKGIPTKVSDNGIVGGVRLIPFVGEVIR